MTSLVAGVMGVESMTVVRCIYSYQEFSPPSFKTISTFHDHKGHHLHIVFTILEPSNFLWAHRTYFLPFGEGALSLAANSSQQVSYVTRLTVNLFRQDYATKINCVVSVTVQAHGSCEYQWISIFMFGQVDVLRLPSVHFMVLEPVDVCTEDSSEIAKRKCRREEPGLK